MAPPEKIQKRTVWDILNESGFPTPLTLSQIFAEIESATKAFKAKVDDDEAVALQENLDNFRNGQS